MRTKPYTKRDFAEEIVEIFEDLLDQKGIKVPCSNPEEEAERHNDNNCACLYGMEYWNLVDDVEEKVSFYYECGTKRTWRLIVIKSFTTKLKKTEQL